MRTKAALNLMALVMIAAVSSACLGNEETAAPRYSGGLYGPEYAGDEYFCPGCPGVIQPFYLAHAGRGHGGHGHGHGGHGGHH